MVYVPNPTDPTQPTDAVFAETATLEFQALKAYIQSLIPGTAFAGFGNAFRNRLINGDMRIDQRNVGAAINPLAGGFYTCDRWKLSVTQINKLSFQQLSATPPPGFDKYLGFTVATPYASAAIDSFVFFQPIEGNNIYDIAYGTAAGKSTSLSFLVNASVTGSYCVSLHNSATDRSYVTTFVVPVANVWTYITLPNIPPDIIGTWLTNSGIGIYVSFDLGSGSNNQTATTNAWQAGNFYRTPTSVSFVNQAAGSTFQITGVQFEVAAAASSFATRSFGEELRLCQRYFWKTFQQVTAPAQAVGQSTGEITFSAIAAGAASQFPQTIPHPVIMRAIPTVTLFNPTALNAQVRNESLGVDCSSSTAFTPTDRGFSISTVGSAGTLVSHVLGAHATVNADF